MGKKEKKQVKIDEIEEIKHEPVKKKREALEGVDYHRITGARCPKCKMDSAFVSNTLPWEDNIRIRYHDCRRSGCGARFKSIEVLSLLNS